MSSLSVFCSRCGATNEPGGERCHRCGQPVSAQVLLLPAEQQERPRRGMSRRTALLTLVGIAALPVSAGVGYLTYQKLTNPHILTYSGQGTTTSDAAWSPDSTLVASSGWLDGGTVQIWNATTGKILQTCRTDHPGPDMVTLDVIWSADGRSVLAFVGWDNTVVLTAGSRIVEMVQVWDATSGQQVRSIPIMEPFAVNAQGTGTDRPLVRNWALNERYLAAVNAQDQGRLEIWEIATGNKIATLGVESQHPASQAREIAWSPDNEKLAIQWFAQDTTTGQDSQTIEVWNIAKLSKITILNTTSHSSLTSINWAPDSRMLVLGLEDGAQRTYEIWDALAGKRLQTLQPSYFEFPLTIWSPNGKYLALGSEVYSVETGNRITVYTTQGMVTSLAWSPDSTRMALVDSVKHGAGFSSTSSTLFLLDALSGRQRASYAGGGLFGNSGTSGKLVWSPDGKYVMVVGQNVDIWRGE